MIDSIPVILTNSFFAFKASIPNGGIETFLNEMSLSRVNYNALIEASIKFVLAYLLLTNKNKIAAKVEKMN